MSKWHNNVRQSFENRSSWFGDANASTIVVKVFDEAVGDIVGTFVVIAVTLLTVGSTVGDDDDDDDTVEDEVDVANVIGKVDTMLDVVVAAVVDDDDDFGVNDVDDKL